MVDGFYGVLALTAFKFLEGWARTASAWFCLRWTDLSLRKTVTNSETESFMVLTNTHLSEVRDRLLSWI